VPPTATPDVLATQTARALATQTAQAAATANAQATIAALPKPMILSGKGDKVTQKIKLGKGPARVTTTYQGSGYFGVKFLSTEGDELDLVVNTTTPNYKGSTYIPVETAGEYLFQVQASGNWELKIQDVQILNEESAAPGPIYKGVGDSAILIHVPSAGLNIFKTARPGKGYFGVMVMSGKDGTQIALLANTTDANYKGEHPEKASAGDFFVKIQAEGEWSLEVSQ